MLAVLNAMVLGARIKSDDPVVIIGAIVFIIAASVIWSYIKRGMAKGQQKMVESVKNRSAAKKMQSGVGPRDDG